MTPPHTTRHHRFRALTCALVIASASLLPAAATPGSAVSHDSLWAAAPTSTAQPAWRWPVQNRVQITHPYDAPEHDYAPGHRGIDLAVVGGAAVVSPADGTIVWVGKVADRALVTIDHGGGHITTLEPVVAIVTAGDAVEGGEVVGHVATGGHTEAGSVHWGVRLNGDYINPVLLLSAATKPVLLPCCG